MNTPNKTINHATNLPNREDQNQKKNSEYPVRSESMSYGMMICVQMDKKTGFDALWNWAVTYMYVTEEGHPNKGYFSRVMNYDGTPGAEHTATRSPR